MPAPLRLDLHTHPKIAKRTPFRLRDVERSLAAARARGLDGLALAEHAHAIGFWEVYHDLLAHWPYASGRFEIDGALLYPALELTLDENVDIVFIGPLNELRRLDGAFLHPLTAGYHPSAYELSDRMATLDLDLIRIAAHPVREDKPASRIPDSLLASLVHAMEINARFSDAASMRRVDEMAARLRLPVVGGSDAHVWPQVAAACTIVHTLDDSYPALRDAVLDHRVEAELREDADRLVGTADRWKARLKERRPRQGRLPHLNQASEAVYS